MGFNTSVAAICATRSRTVGIPSGRRRPSALGMYRRRTSCGRYVPARNAVPSSSRNASTPRCLISASVSESTPAEPRIRLTRRHASQRTSSLQIRSIRAWKRRFGDRLAAAHRRRCNWRTLPRGGHLSGVLGPVSPAMPRASLRPRRAPSLRPVSRPHRHDTPCAKACHGYECRCIASWPQAGDARDVLAQALDLLVVDGRSRSANSGLAGAARRSPKRSA